MFELAWQFKVPVGVLERQISGQEATEWIEFLRERSEAGSSEPGAARTYDWHEMKDRFLKVKDLQGQVGKRVVERK